MGGLLPRITPAVGLYPDSRPDPLGDFMASLERVAELAPEIALPGHGQPIDDPAARARAIIEHLIAAHPGSLHLICQAELGPLYEKFGFRALEYGEMPKYFRRIFRLAGLLNAVGHIGGFLVMCRN